MQYVSLILLIFSCADRTAGTGRLALTRRLSLATAAGSCQSCVAEAGWICLLLRTLLYRVTGGGGRNTPPLFPQCKHSKTRLYAYMRVLMCRTAVLPPRLRFDGAIVHMYCLMYFRVLGPCKEPVETPRVEHDLLCLKGMR